MAANNRIEMEGRVFGRLTVLRVGEKRTGGRLHWECRCECGNLTVASGKYLRSGQTRSCGCLHREVIGAIRATHRMTDTRTYKCYRSMLSRCFNDKQESYSKYGGAGITVCERWRGSFESFFGDMGECPEGMTLDRINPFGDYEPGNCRWANARCQANNRRGDVAVRVLEQLKRNGLSAEIDRAFEAVIHKERSVEEAA